MNRNWILLRGLMRDARHFEDFPIRLAAALGDEVHCLDLPGNGTRCGETSPFNVSAMARAVRREAKTKGLRPPFHLLAVSLGGMVALEWAHLFCPELEGLVLVNTSAQGLAPFYQRLRWQTYETVFKDILLAQHLRQREAAIINLTVNLAPARQDLLQRWTRYAVECATSKENALRQLAAAARYRLPLPLPNTPMLVLRSLQDRLVGAENSARLADIALAPLATHPTAGHELLLDDPAWVIEQIQQWLAGGIPGAVPLEIKA